MLLEATYDAELPPQVEALLRELSAKGSVESRILRSFLTCDEVYVVTPATAGFSELVEQMFAAQTGVDGLRALFGEAAKRTYGGTSASHDRSKLEEDAAKSGDALAVLRAAARQRRCACALWYLCFLITEVALGLGLGPRFVKVFGKGSPPPLIRSDAAPEAPATALDEDAALDVVILRCCLETISIDVDKFLGAQARSHLQQTEASWLERGLTFALGLPTFESDADANEAAASLYDLQLISSNFTLLLLSMCDEPVFLLPQAEEPNELRDAASAVGYDCLDAIMLVGQSPSPSESDAQPAERRTRAKPHKSSRKAMAQNLASRLVSMLLQRLVRRPQPPTLRSRVRYIMRQREIAADGVRAADYAAAGAEAGNQPDGSLAATALNVLSLGLLSAPDQAKPQQRQEAQQVKAFPGRMAYPSALALDTAAADEAESARMRASLVEQGKDGTFTVVITESPLGLSLEQRYIRGADGSSRQCIFRINDVIAGGAADRTGHIKVGDRLLSVNNVSTEALSLEECGDLIRSMLPDTPLTLGFLRPPTEEGSSASTGPPDADSLQSWEDIGAAQGTGLDEEEKPAASSGGWLGFLGFGGDSTPAVQDANEASAEDRAPGADGPSEAAIAETPVEEIPRLAAVALPPVGTLANPSSKSPLADQNLLLLLLLMQYHLESSETVGEDGQELNPFRAAVASLRDVSLPKNRREMQLAQEKLKERKLASSSAGGAVDLTVPNWVAKERAAQASPDRPDASPETLMLAYCARGNFDGVIQELCTMLQNEEMYAASLLLYSLLQGCPAFVQHIRCSCDARVALLIGSLIEAQFHVTLSLSGLRNGHAVATKTREWPGRTQFRVHISNLYILVIDMLILVQDVAFCHALFTTMDLPETSAAWISSMCKAHPLTRTLNPAAGTMNCGSALFMVTLVMMKFNLAQANNDTYLQSNLFAMLLNLCACAQNLSSQVTQRFFTFLLATVRDYRKICAKVQEELAKKEQAGDATEQAGDATEQEDGRFAQLLQSATMVEETMIVLLKGLVMMLRPRALQDNISVLYNYLLHADGLKDLPKPLRIPQPDAEEDAPGEPLVPPAGLSLLQAVYDAFHDESQEPSVERLTEACMEINDLIYISRVQDKLASVPERVARLLELDEASNEVNYVYEESEDAAAFFRPQTWRVVLQRWPGLWSRLASGY